MINLGVIGLSPGNGHPYSWSAIFNGYSKREMEKCGFPSIPEYLNKRNWPDECIKEARVTHIWTQSRSLSLQIAAATLIPNVVDSLHEMIGKVDAVLLARDDAENHRIYAEIFINAGIPIFIDKPIALSISELDYLYSLKKYDWQIFTCSALRYAEEFKLTKSDINRIGKIKYISATTSMDWDKYAVHVIEPILKILGTPNSITCVSNFNLDSATYLRFKMNENLLVDIAALGDLAVAPLELSIYGSVGYKKLTFIDTFAAFKSALQDFIEGINEQSCKSPYDFNCEVTKIIELGRKKNI